jgi:heptosyltransferase-2
MQKFLVIRFSSLGDIVLSSVITQQLARDFPDSPITFLTKSQYQSLAGILPGVTRVKGYDSRQSLLSLIREFNQEKFDNIIDLHSNWRSFWVRNLTRANRTAHYRSHRLKRLSMVLFPGLKTAPVSTTQCYLDSLLKLGISADGVQPRIQPKEEDIHQANSFLLKRGVEPGSLLIGIAPGAKWETKKWPSVKFGQLTLQLQEKLKSTIVFFGSAEESNLLEDLAERAPHSLVAKNLELNLLAALIQKCSLMISNDSGLMHVSSASGVPTVAIFGPTHPKLGFAPAGSNNVVLTANQPCSPCSLHGQSQCFQPSQYCLDNITVEMVWEAATKLLRRQAAVLAADEK